MTASVGANQNTNDEPVQQRRLVLNSTTALDVAGVNLNRCWILIQNIDMNRDVWIRLHDAAVGDAKEGIFLVARGTGINVLVFGDGSAMFQGPISAIADSGTPEIAITEF